MALLAAALWFMLPREDDAGDGSARAGLGALLEVPRRLGAGLGGVGPESVPAGGDALVRWPATPPIPYLVAGRIGDDERAFIARRLGEIAAVTGLRFDDVGDRPFLTVLDGVDVRPPPEIATRLASFAFPSAGWDMTDRGAAEAKTSYLLRLAEGPWVIWWEAPLVVILADAAAILAILRHRTDLPAGTADAYAAGRMRCALDVDHHPADFRIRRALILVPGGTDDPAGACIGRLLAAAMGGTLGWIASQSGAAPSQGDRSDREPRGLTCEARVQLRVAYDRLVPLGVDGARVAGEMLKPSSRRAARRDCGPE